MLLFKNIKRGNFCLMRISLFQLKYLKGERELWLTLFKCLYGSCLFFIFYFILVDYFISPEQIS